MKSNKYEIDMCNGSIMDKLVSFALPLMLSGILQLMFNAVDIIVVGRFSGSEALAAVSSTTALINVLPIFLLESHLGQTCLQQDFCCRTQGGNVRDRTYLHHACANQRNSHGVCWACFFQRGIGINGNTGRCDRTVDALYADLLYGNAVFMLYNYGAAILRAVGDTKDHCIF